MFSTVRKDLFFKKANLLFYKGIEEGKIIPFDDEFYNEMSKVLFNGIPISMHIKYLRPVSGLGKCFDRSLYMFFCFDDALLVRGNDKALELTYGKGHGGHGWIEIGDYVYDPTLLLRFDRDLYYKMYGITRVKKYTKDDYIRANGDYYDSVRNTKVEDYQIGGSKRVDLCISIPFVKGIADCSDDVDFKNDLSEYLELIQYDERQVYDELRESCAKLF